MNNLAVTDSHAYNSTGFHFCSFSSTLDDMSYHSIADETLDAIAELFEDLGEGTSSPSDYDVQLSVSLHLISFARFPVVLPTHCEFELISFVWLTVVFSL